MRDIKRNMKKMNNENVLKGQHNLAQGNALGSGIEYKIVRAIMVIKEKFFFRTKGIVSVFVQKMPFNSLPAAGRRPKGVYTLDYQFTRTIFAGFPGRCPGLN
jgi:hypothetical protein